MQTLQYTESQNIEQSLIDGLLNEVENAYKVADKILDFIEQNSGKNKEINFNNSKYAFDNLEETLPIIMDICSSNDKDFIIQNYQLMTSITINCYKNLNNVVNLLN